MKIKIKPKIKPQVGDKQEFIKFAWLPITIGNTIVWLEKYRLTKILEIVEFAPDMLSNLERRLVWVKYRSFYKTTGSEVKK